MNRSIPLLSNVQRLKGTRSGLVVLLTLIVVGTSTLTRIALLIKSVSSVDFTFLNVAGLFLIGLLYDLINATYVCIPLVLFLWWMPRRFFATAWHQYVIYGWFTVFIFFLLFNGVAEWFFWDEFNTRFNFIAVDYLVYTNEVIGNIRQSYPIGIIISMISLLSLTIVFLLRNLLKCRVDAYSFSQRSKVVGVFALVLVPLTIFSSTRLHRFSDNTYVNELAGNGLYELFAAYRNNELDYDQFYKKIERKQALGLVRSLVKTKEAEYTDTGAETFQRKVTHDGEEKKLNVVLISVESFSADFMGSFGNDQSITPFLDSLAQHSLFFTRLYATGTRTVRGLEALSLCVPPTPGQSIVRRPNNENLFSLGKVFEKKGYESQYIYGGYGYFDNMNYFFANNGYEVTDRTAIDDEDIDYENVWGVADENLFELATKKIDEATNSRPVFSHIMTTSNHRPYTYPEGRIDIPSHTSREGAVKYTDYSIGKFIKESRNKPWFGNTLFVIVADHCASSAGKTDLPIDRYHIPMLIYAPSVITPARMDRLMSQIDIGPTLLGLLNFSYDSKFYGYDIFALEPGRERAFISTYQNLGYVKGDKLVVLSPQQKIDCYTISNGEQVKTDPDDVLIEEAVAWYQSASYAFSHGLMKSF